MESGLIVTIILKIPYFVLFCFNTSCYDCGKIKLCLVCATEYGVNLMLNHTLDSVTSGLEILTRIEV